MPSSYYEDLLKEGQILVLPDMYPWSGAHVMDNSILDGLVTNCTVSTGANISSVDIRFPKKTFGDHVTGVTPIKVCFKSADNIIFRGFITEENGILSESDDTITVKALGYKWYFSKCTRIRGRWFTSDDAIPEPYGSPNTTGHDKMKYEMFRGPLVRDHGHSGYIQDEPCIFNENALPTCLTKTRSGALSIFKYRKMFVKENLQYVREYNYGANYWTFSSILAHIVYWWLDPYSGYTTTIKISNSSFSQLSRLSADESVPMDLNIEGKNPLEAIDYVVKQIPGKWIWYLRYYGTVVSIEIRNIDSSIMFKKLYIGDGSKQAENPANVASINVTRNWEETSSFLICKGGKLRFTTTVELQPVWKFNTIGTVTELPFKSVTEFNEWKSYVTNKDKATIDTDKRDLYERAYRYYCIPKEGAFLRDALENVDFRKVAFTGRLKMMYSAIEVELKKMFAQNVYLKRDLDAPCNPSFENPIIFAYDEYRSKQIKKGGDKDNYADRVIFFDTGYNFDNETGLVIFDKPQYCRFKKPSIVKTGTGENITPEQGEDKDVNETAESVVDIEAVSNINGAYNEVTDSLTTFPLRSRRIFCTLTIVLDMPYVVGDDVFGLNYEEGGNFARYVDFDGNDLIIHANAFYPILPNDSVTLNKTNGYIIAKKKGIRPEVMITDSMSKSIIYPIEHVKNYEMFPDNNEQVLFQKLDNMKEAIIKNKETISADLGVLDNSYQLGDIIVAVENSKNENFGSGYYGVKDYISQISWNLEGQNRGYTTILTCTNDVEYTPSDFDKTMSETIKRPSVLDGVYKNNSYLEVENG